MTRKQKLPLQAQRILSERRRFEEVIIFVHHFGGNRSSTRMHQEFVSELGFDSVTFDLSFNSLKNWKRPPVTRDLKVGMRHVWAKEITQIMDALPERKILFSFSFPSASALEAIYLRNAKDVSGWICDGGPFFRLMLCMWNYYTHQWKLKNPLVKMPITASSYNLMSGFAYQSDTKKYLKHLPQHFPILSIRAWQDRMVPISAIDAVFEGQKHLDLQMVGLPESDHLQGLMRFPDEYKPRVERFLKQVAHPLESEPPVASPT